MTGFKRVFSRQSQDEESELRPISVGIIYNVELTSVVNTLNTLNSARCNIDYVIITMDTKKSDVENFRVYKNFRWVTLSLDREPLSEVLTRHLCKRCLTSSSSGDVTLTAYTTISWLDHFCKNLKSLIDSLPSQSSLRIGREKRLSFPKPRRLHCIITPHWTKYWITA